MMNRAWLYVYVGCLTGFFTEMRWDGLFNWQVTQSSKELSPIASSASFVSLLSEDDLYGVLCS